MYQNWVIVNAMEKHSYVKHGQVILQTTEQKFDSYIQRLSTSLRECEGTQHPTAFQDLFHILRIWADLHPVVGKTFPSFATARRFKVHTPKSSALRSFNGDFVLAHFPDNVLIHALIGDGKQNFGSIFETTDRRDWMHSGRYMADVSGALHISWACFALGEYEAMQLDIFATDKKTFVQWLDGTCVWMRQVDDGEGKLFTFSRKMLIARLATMYDGSHPSVATFEDKKRGGDRQLEILMQMNLAGLPLPYVIALNLGNAILNAAKAP